MEALFCAVIFTLITLGISAIICIATTKRDQKTCFRHTKNARRSCGGADNMNDFVCNDCASCPYWTGKP